MRLNAVPLIFTRNLFKSPSSFQNNKRDKNGAAAGESARAQTFLLQEAMRPGVPLAFERRNGVGAVIQLEIVAGTIIGRVENA